MKRHSAPSQARGTREPCLDSFYAGGMTASLRSQPFPITSRTSRPIRKTILDRGVCAPTVGDSFSSVAQSRTNGDICTIRSSPPTICGRKLDSFTRTAQPWTLTHSASQNHRRRIYSKADALFRPPDIPRSPIRPTMAQLSVASTDLLPRRGSIHGGACQVFLGVCLGLCRECHPFTSCSAKSASSPSTISMSSEIFLSFSRYSP